MNFWEELKSGKFARMVKESSKGRQFIGPEAVFNIIKPLTAAHDDIEVVYGIFLDTKGHIMALEQLASGTINLAVVYPREVIKAALKQKASGIILVHNHPSGDPTPSKSDNVLTMRLYIALGAVGIKLLDHMVIGDAYYSYADEGKLKQMKKQYESLFKALA